MITHDQAFSADEFHIAHSMSDSLPCTVWHRAGNSHEMVNSGFWLPIERDGDDGRQWHHITRANAFFYHVADECPHVLRMSDDQPPVAHPVLSVSDRSEDDRDADGFDIWGYDASGYDRNGYDADGYDSGGYDADGYDANGYDADGDPRPGSLDAGDLDLGDLWDTFTGGRSYNYRYQDGFRQHLRSLVSAPDEIDDLEFCADCSAPAWDDDLRRTGGGSDVCESCWDEMVSCHCCDERFLDDDLTETLNETSVCDSCRASYYTWCDYCDGYRSDDDYDHDHARGDGCCESPQPEFSVRNDGCEPLANDTRFEIELPAGTISEEGLSTIRDYLFRQSYSADDDQARIAYRELSRSMGDLGDQWQTRNGNYVKRLSRHAYQKHQLKLSQDVMSNVGNIARDHSTAVSVAIEVTRDLNLPAYEFYHEDSCWWGSYGESRCALKTNGGFGLRSFSGSRVTGRAWVMPLRKDENGRLVATFETMTPDAFVVFNGYGDLSGYAPARIVAHMAGWTYRKIGFQADPMYVNAGGYLIAAEDTAQPYTDGHLRLDTSQHSRLFERETERELVNA